MTPTPAQLLAELKEKAKAATPGPWEAVSIADTRGQPVPYYHALIGLLHGGEGNGYVSVVQSDERTVTPDIAQQEANAEHIAAANPAAIQTIATGVEALVAALESIADDTIFGDDKTMLDWARKFARATLEQWRGKR